MRSKKVFVLLFFLLLSFVFLGFILKLNFSRSATSPDSSPVLTTPTLAWVNFTNSVYGFSLSYPSGWVYPIEKEILPAQQHLKQFIFDSGKEKYSVDLYKQLLPVSLGSFVRDYFSDASWTNETDIGGQPIAQFFIPKMGVEPMGIAGVAFQKKDLVLTICTPIKNVADGDLKNLVNDSVLTQMVKSFKWLE